MHEMVIIASYEDGATKQPLAIKEEWLGTDVFPLYKFSGAMGIWVSINDVH